jgi:Fe-S cluster biogenesis protein NfuA
MPDQEQDQIHIMATPTPNPDALKFTVDRPVMQEGSAFFASPEDGKGSHLAELIFDLGGIRSIFITGNMITAKKDNDADWSDLARPIGAKIREHIRSGEPPVSETATASRAKTDTEKKIEEVLAEIRPYVQGDGGDIVFAGYEDGIVTVFMQGACAGCPSSTATLRLGIEQRLKEVVPEVKEVVPM